MKRVSIRSGFTDAIESSDDSLGRFPVQMMKWAKYIEKEIGSVKGHKVKAVTVTVTGCYINLPPDCYQVLGVFPGDYEDECNIQYRDITSPLIQEDVIEGVDVYGRDLTYLWVPMNTTWIKALAWEEVADQLHMIQKYDNQEMTLVYNYIETDQKGYWIVNESHIDAISKYIQFKFAKKFRWKMFKSDKLLRQGHMITLKDLEKDYNTAVRHARAEDGKEDPHEQAQY
jgi:hypothetical protein